MPEWKLIILVNTSQHSVVMNVGTQEAMEVGGNWFDMKKIGLLKK